MTLVRGWLQFSSQRWKVLELKESAPFCSGSSRRSSANGSCAQWWCTSRALAGFLFPNEGPISALWGSSRPSRGNPTIQAAQRPSRVALHWLVRKDTDWVRHQLSFKYSCELYQSSHMQQIGSPICGRAYFASVTFQWLWRNSATFGRFGRLLWILWLSSSTPISLLMWWLVNSPPLSSWTSEDPAWSFDWRTQSKWENTLDRLSQVARRWLYLSTANQFETHLGSIPRSSWRRVHSELECRSRECLSLEVITWSLYLQLWRSLFVHRLLLRKWLSPPSIAIAVHGNARLGMVGSYRRIGRSGVVTREPHCRLHWTEAVHVRGEHLQNRRIKLEVERVVECSLKSARRLDWKNC